MEANAAPYPPARPTWRKKFRREMLIAPAYRQLLLPVTHDQRSVIRKTSHRVDRGERLVSGW
jgi:hypothetical protein